MPGNDEVPLTIDLSNLAVSTGFTGSGALATGLLSADFARTLSLPTSDPVFDLPAGVSVNPPDGVITCDQVTGGGAGLLAVTEPSSFLLRAVGLTVLGLPRRRGRGPAPRAPG